MPVIILPAFRREVSLPLYEYRCQECGSHLEKIQKFSGRPLTTCKKCGGKLERLLSSPAIQFKGSGWYVTDYARKSEASETGKSESPTAGEAKKTGGTSPATEAPGGKPASTK